MNNSRRNFIQRIIKTVALFSISTVSFSKVISKPKSMFVHHVFFWIKPDASQDDKNKLYEGLQSLLTIESLTFSHIGIPANTNRPVIDTSYTYSLLTVFENEKGHDIYQEHPLHKKFIQDCQALWVKVQIYDSVNRK